MSARSCTSVNGQPPQESAESHSSSECSSDCSSDCSSESSSCGGASPSLAVSALTPGGAAETISRVPVSCVASRGGLDRKSVVWEREEGAEVGGSREEKRRQGEARGGDRTEVADDAG